MQTLSRQNTEENRVHLKAYCDSVRGYIARGKVTTIKCPSSNRVLCRDIELTDIEVKPALPSSEEAGLTTFYRVGPILEHAYIDRNLLVETEDNSFIGFVQVSRYERFDGTVSYGFTSLPELLELELRLKIEITRGTEKQNEEKRMDSLSMILCLIDRMVEVNRGTKGLDKLSSLKIDFKLIALARQVSTNLINSIGKTKKKKKKKGFGCLYNGRSSCS